MFHQRGFSTILILLGVIVIIGLAGGIYYLGKSKPTAFKPQDFVVNSPTSQPASTKTSTGLANPASVNCEQKGGKLEVRTAPSGAQYGVCKFNDGTECEEWAYFNVTCKPGQYKNWEENINKQPNLKISFYTTGFTTNITDQTNELSSTKNSWTEKDNAKYFFLGIKVQNTSNFSSTGRETTLKVTGDINKDIAIPILGSGQYSQNIPLFIPLPPQNNILRMVINEDKSINESDYFDDYIFVSLKEGTIMTEKLPGAEIFDFEKQIATQLKCNDLKLINRVDDFPNCSR